MELLMRLFASRCGLRRRKDVGRGKTNRGSGPGATLANRPGTLLLLRGEPLPLGDAARELFDLLFLGAARFGPLGLGSGLLAGGALQLLPFLYIFNLGSVCHL